MRQRRLLAIAFLFLHPGTFAAPAFAAESAENLIARARQAYDRGEKDEALALADKAVAAEPKDVRVYLFRASLHEAGRDFAKAAADYGRVIELDPKASNAYQRRGAAHFRMGRVKESIADFDKFIEMNPGQEPYHWQRGISHYYAGEFALGRKQFESHQTVNTQDVENAVWHYLCVARVEGPDAARRLLIPIQDDGRIPMMKVHAMFAGKATPDDVLATARAGNPAEAELNDRLFYAHLYVGLFHEANGDAKAAAEHIALAAGKYAADHYMGDVARVHAMVLKEKATPGAKPGAKPRGEAGARARRGQFTQVGAERGSRAAVKPSEP
jgi:lipoprotein NlpI